MAIPIAELSRALNGVKTVGAAKVAAAKAVQTLGEARGAADSLPSSAFAGLGSRAAAVKSLDNSIVRIRDVIKTAVGNAPDSRGIGPWWQTLRNEITKGYITAFDVYERGGQSSPGFLSGLVEQMGAAVLDYNKKLEGKGLLEAAGTIIGDVGRQAGKGVGAAGKGISEGAKEAAGGILGPLKWILISVAAVALVGGGVYVAIATRGIKAPGA